MIEQCRVTLLKEICGLRKKMLNFKILKVHRQCDKVLDNIKWRKLIFCLQPHAHGKVKTMSLPQYATI